ncbi:unnamed protein product [Arctogadus glacialis]
MEEKLIIAVGSRPILYDQSLYTYRDTTLKDRAWQDVSLEVGETAAECVKRWRSLRDRYRRERVKEKEAQRSGAGADKQPVWRYMAVMGFLAPFLQNRGTTSNLPHRNPSPVSVMVVIEEHGEAGALSLAADEAAPAPGQIWRCHTKFVPGAKFVPGSSSHVIIT